MFSAQLFRYNTEKHDTSTDALPNKEVCMAEFTIVSPQELQEREHKPKGQPGRHRSPERTRIIEEYKTALREVQPGYGVDVTLAEGEEKRHVRHNLKLAAHELHLALDFRGTRDPARMHFRVLTPEEAARKPKRGGRPRKTQPV